MASRNTVARRSLNRGSFLVSGSFAPNGSSAVSASSRKGLGWTVARTSTGLFTVTTTDKFTDLLSARLTLQLATGDDQVLQVGTVSLTAKTVQIRVWDISGAAVADIAADANNRIHFEFEFLNSAVKPTAGT